jgi:hypothetical protein
MAESNLIVLSKFDRKDIIEPTEQHSICSKHYAERKEEFKDYQLNKVVSSMPETWCEICTPPEWNY